MVCAVNASWVLKVCGAATAILEFESQDEALSIGSAIAARKGVALVLQERCGTMQLMRPALPLAA
ncbi:DUF2188 domain-containing protein [Cupriavidus basilensis]